MDSISIAALLKQERYYRDTRQWSKLRNCYHAEDSKTFINISWYKGGIDGFVSGSQKLTSDDILIVHDITPIVIEFGTFDTSKALCESTGRIWGKFIHDGVDMLMTSWVRFFTQLEKVSDGEWKMLSLEVVYLYDTLAPCFPQPPHQPLDLDFSIVEGARKSYKAIAWHVGQLGATIRDDLPGADKPETVKEVEDRNKAWLSAP